MSPSRSPPKNPVLKTREPTVPPGLRSRAALRLTAAACEGRLELQRCRACSAFQYPPREACTQCLSTRLEWTECDGVGELISETILHHSNEPYFRERVPLRVGLVRLDVGVTIVAHVDGACAPAPARIRLAAHLDKSGQAALVAHPPEGPTDMTTSQTHRDMTCDPRGRKILVTDGKSETGEALVKAFIAAGADKVWAGVAEPWKDATAIDKLAQLEGVTTVPLDVTDARSVEALSGLIGGKVDILVNNAEFHRHKPVGARGVETARAEMDVNYLGLLRLIESFGPALKFRAADGPNGACAWVNILSVYALSALPSQATFTASKAAAFAASQALRADMMGVGIRVMNVFPGPIDDAWNQTVPPPKLAPSALAAAVVASLKAGVEDVYPGDVAQDILARWRESAKVLERELADQ
ncbi:SDR family NAD(P)-dependent oxidoreductase [Microvirga antarctica]|uniref:SDR family NAD(P)-dependent oxidoreductase n=1 Tax=Microvirga antarctica TaxID=2819233 RepID=UPI001B300D76|nr:SDR family NAD(P)-dependent oxidoreductase [Microvirga antarctica]